MTKGNNVDLADISSRFNTILTTARLRNDKGVYDIHTNTVQWPRAMQPTHARWENVEQQGADAEENSQKKLVNGTNEAADDVDGELASMFSKVDPVYPRNFLIHDLYLQSAEESSLGPPGPDNDCPGLSNLPSDVLDELPADCRQAFEEARRRETAWRSQWHIEATDGHRGRFMSTVEWFP